MRVLPVAQRGRARPLNALLRVPVKPTRREPCGRDTIGTPLLVSLYASISYVEAHLPTRGEGSSEEVYL
jgi:hypothetical protein